MSNNTERTNRAYTERSMVVRMLCSLAAALGHDFGYGLDDSENDEEWRRVIYIQFPDGQVSWHISPDDWHMFEGIKKFSGTWDGTYNSRDTEYVKKFSLPDGNDGYGKDSWGAEDSWG